MSFSGSAFSDLGQRPLHGTMLNLLWPPRLRASVHVLSWRLTSASSASLQTRLGRLMGYCMRGSSRTEQVITT